MLVRFNVHVLEYAPGDEVELPKEWSDRLVPSHATNITKKATTKDEAEPEAEPEAEKAKPKTKVEAPATTKK